MTKALLSTCLEYENSWHFGLKKESHNPHYFYHVSVVPLGNSDGKEFEKIKLKPRCICSSESELLSIKRICVAPTVEQAINACAQMIEASNDLFIYRTAKKRKCSYIPYGVFDAPLTGERWLMNESTFVLVGRIKTGSLHKKHSYRALISSKQSVKVSFNDRGGVNSLNTQRNELPRVRKFLHKNKEIFYSDEEHLRNYAQSSNKFNKRFIK